MTPQRIGSHYLLHEQIGSGGMGTVWRAEDTESGTWLAVKVLRPEYARDPAAVGRFVRERNALIALRHPNIVTLHDMIVEGEQLALVMDLLTEGDLDKLRRAHSGTLPPALAAELIAQACDGLAAAHAAGIVHRDLKPGNVLIDHGQARLTDFGIARIGGEVSVTSAGIVLGTLSYMAPEALAGGAPAPASDVYSAGITLYELLAGQPPFTGQAPVVITGHMHTAPQRPDSVPEPLWRVIAACLAKDPAARPSAAQLAAALRSPGIAPGPGATVLAGPGVPAGAPAGGGGGWGTAGGAWATGAAAASGRTGPAAGVAGPTGPGVWAAAPQAAAPNAGPDARPHTMTGIGWVTPAGPAAPPGASNGPGAWQAPPVPAPARAKSGLLAGRRRNWAIAAAVLLVLGAAGGAFAATSGGGAKPAADTVAAASTAAQASLAGAASSASASGSASPHPSASKSKAKTASPSPTASQAAPAPTAVVTVTQAAPKPKPTPKPTPTVSGLIMENLLGKWCLTVAGNSTAGGAALEESACSTANTADQWTIRSSVVLNSATYYQYQNVHSGLCIGVTGSSQAVDAVVDQGACSATTDHSQFWKSTYLSGSDYEMVNGHSGLCAGFGGGSSAENSTVLQGKCIGATVQTWFTLASP